MSYVIESFLARLDHVRRSGSGWEARCPAHEDSKNSLSVSEGEDGRVLVHCHAGCSPDAVVAALGMTLSNLFDGKRRSNVISEYDYLDEDGNLLSQVVRFFPKNFRQRRPNGRGGWEWKLGDTRRVLYRLPHVIEAVGLGKSIHVVEGEKDVHALESIGAVATCNAGGAGKWRDEYSEHLRGADVRIIADRDEPGVQHATEVAQALEGIARSVRILEAKQGKDAADHVDAGHGLDDFVPVRAGDREAVQGQASEDIEDADPGWPGDPDIPGPPTPDNLPLDALPSVLRENVESVAASVQISADAPALLSLLAVSAAVGGRVEARIDGAWPKEWCVLYGIAVLPSGERKSPTFTEMVRPIEQWESERLDEVMPKYLAAMDRLEVAEKKLDGLKRGAAAKKKKATLDEVEAARLRLEDAKKAVPILPALLVGDATPEALVRRMAAQEGRAAIMSPEGDFLHIVDGLRSNGKARLEELKKGWSGEPLRPDRITRDTAYVRRPAITLGLTQQPSVLGSLDNGRSMSGEGLFARILWLRPKSLVGRRSDSGAAPKLDEGAAGRYAEMLHHLLDAKPKAYEDDGTPIPHRIGFTEDALGHLYSYQRELERQKAGGQRLAGICSWAEKAHGQAVRIAVMLTMAARASAGSPLFDDPVGGNAMHSAIRLMRALTAHALVVLGEMEMDQETTDLRYLLDRAAEFPNNTTTRELHQATRGRKSIPNRAMFDELLAKLEERGCVKVTRNRTGGRPSETFQLHLKIRDGHTQNTQKPSESGSRDPFESFEHVKPAPEVADGSAPAQQIDDLLDVGAVAP